VDDWDVEAFAETLPHVSAHAVAPGHPNLVLPLQRVRRGIDQIAAELADVLKDGGLAGGDFRPECALREFPAETY
jgi:hypothetical protein